MNSSNTPNRDRLHWTSSTNTGHDATYKTALKGASLAFQKGAANTSNSLSTSAPARQTTNGNGNANGALIAATSASRDHSLSRPPSVNQLATASALSRQSTGRSSTVTHNAQLATGQSHLLAPARATAVDPRSPSFIAATLAASRSTSPSPKAAPTTYPYSHQYTARGFPRGILEDDDANNSVADLDLTTDTSSIGPANSLISLFERKMDEVDPVKKSPTTTTARKGFNAKPGLRPLTPPKTTDPVVSFDTSPSRLASAFAWEKASPSQVTTKYHIGLYPQSQNKTIDVESKRQPPTPPPARTKRGTKLPEPEPVPKAERKLRPVTPPKTISRSPAVVLSPQPRKFSSQKIVESKSDQTSSSDDRSLAEPIPQRRTSPLKATARANISSASTKDPDVLLRRSSTSLSTDTFVSASSTPSVQPDSPRRKNSTPSTTKARLSLAPVPSPSPALLNAGLIPPPRPALQVQRPPSSNIALESLTNAIVAGSLASARAPPRAKKPPTPPPRKQTPHMRQTLRAPRTKSEEEEVIARSQGKKSFAKLSSRKKHSHHEGTRKRWREEITAHERQRYEGVWASNRGMLLDELSAAANGLRDVDTSLLVANVVVRDIWSRSRLPLDELAEVWDLVDTRGKGVLDKPEFVVGMWLVDQRLRGRKIPPKVSESVWGSAKGVRVLGPQERKK